MVVLAMGPGGRYLIVAVVILLIVCGGVFLAYRMNSRSSGRSRGTGAAGTRRRDGSSP